MSGEVAGMVFTDPPYNVPIEGHVGGLGRVQHREFAMASGEMTEAEFTAFLDDRRSVTLPRPPRTVPFTSSAWTGGTSWRCWRPAEGATPS